MLTFVECFSLIEFANNFFNLLLHGFLQGWNPPFVKESLPFLGTPSF